MTEFWVLIGLVAMGIVVYFLSEYDSTKSFRRLAKSSEERNDIEARKLTELVFHNQWERTSIPRAPTSPLTNDQLIALAKAQKQIKLAAEELRGFEL